jgi:flagellar protein FlaI
LKGYIARRNIIYEIFPVNEPHAYAIVSFDPVNRRGRYEVIEPTLFDHERNALKQISEHLKATIDTTMSELGSRKDAIAFFRNKLEEATRIYKLGLSEPSKEILLYYLIRDYLDYGKIDVMMRDPMIEDVSCNGPEIPLYIWHRTYESIPTNIRFDTDAELDSYIIRLAYKASRMITVANPLLDGSLPDGSRVQLTYGRHITKQGSTYTIRKFKEDPLTIVDLIINKTLSADIAALLWYLVENRISVFVCGGIASGKTTTLNCVSMFIDPNAKIVTIEDTPEVQLYHDNWIRAIARPKTSSSEGISLFDLLRTSMRQRPDYILVGEIRGAEAYTLFQAMSTGHLGLSTLHAESADAALRRLETQPMNIPRMMLASLHMIVVMARLEHKDKPVRKVISCSEVQGLTKKGDINLSTLVEWNSKGDQWRLLGNSYYLQRAAEKRGIEVDEAMKDITRRTEILNALARQGKRNFVAVTQTIRDYLQTPDIVYDTLVGRNTS